MAQLVRKVRLVALRRLLTPANPPLPEGLTRPHAAARDALVAAVGRAGDVVLEAVGAPDVLPHLLAWEAGLRPADESLRAAIPAFLVALGPRWPSDAGALTWDVPFDRLPDARRKRGWRFAPPATAISIVRGGVEVVLHDGTRVLLDGGKERDGEAGVESGEPFHALDDAHPRLHLAEWDSNPLAMVEEHPDKSGNAVDLGGRSIQEWTASLRDALALVRIGLPTWHAELSVTLERLVPVGYDAERHLSATYREAPGVAYVSLHPDPLTLAEAIVHETQHGKLNVLSWLDPVLHNAQTCWTASPVRPDLRPLMGVLLAAHAFVPVAALHRGLAQARHPAASSPRFASRQAEVLAANAEGLETLRRQAEPTPIGARLLQDLLSLDESLRNGATD